jgi:hypothetical protein
MSLQTQIETPQSISTQGIGSTLENHSTWSKNFHDFANDWSENGLETDIVHPVIQGEVDGVILALSVANIENVSSARKVFSKLVEAHCHYSIGGIKRFLYSISMMNVNINVQNSLMFLE